MKKLYVLLTIICFAIEITTIQLALPKYTQLISSVGFLSFLFYFVLKTEGLTNKTSKSTTKKTKTKIPVKPKSELKKSDKEEEESDFAKEWHNLENEAGA